MIFELVGTGTHNQGAELMAAAVAEALLRRGSDRAILVSYLFGSAQARHRYGLLLKYVRPARFGRGWLIDKLLHPTLRKALELYRGEDVDVILDASGFQYSDQWGEIPARQLEARVAACRDRGQRMILLPQAFGPFQFAPLRQAMQRVLPMIDLVYARDKRSLSYLRDLCGDAPNFRLAPDFTSLVSPIEVVAGPDFPPRAFLVPNQRMLDKTSPDAAASYAGRMALMAERIAKCGVPLAFLVHSAEDEVLAREISRRANSSVDIIRENDPRVLKGCLATALLVIGSRFHALQSALSQGIPCVGLGWSHKYQALFDDYGCPEYCIDQGTADDEVLPLVMTLCDAATRNKVADGIKRASSELKRSTEAMWREIEALLAQK